MLGGDFIIELIFITGLSVAGSINDIKTKTIPKWVTVPLFLSGVAYHVYHAGWDGLANSLSGAILYLLYLLLLSNAPKIVVPWASKQLGPGDHRLALGCGAWVGQQDIVFLMAVYSITFALLKGIIYAFTVKNSGEKITSCFISDIKAELYGWGKPHREAFAPYIIIPFLLTIYILNFLGGN